METIMGRLLAHATLVVATIAWLASPGIPLAASSGSGSPTIFQMPAYAALQVRLTLPVIALFRDQRYADAEDRLRDLVDKFPDWPVHRYNLAAALARQGKSGPALDSLAQALRLGFANVPALERDPDLDSLRGLPRFRELAAGLAQGTERPVGPFSRSVVPRKIEDGRALVDEANTAWEPNSNTLIAGFAFAGSPPDRTVHGGDGRVAELLNSWYAAGEAAGNHGDLYDNRDGDHSAIAKSTFPQLTHVEYGAEARAAKVHYGVNAHLLFNAITVGNSSTAVTGSQMWRSQARLILTSPELVARAYQHYANDHLYLFPEHRDHDPEMGDLLPANTPYMLVSQGSSGSDQPHLRAVFAILAAFRPDVKAFLRARHLVMPTVQMIFRSGLKSIGPTADYLGPRAHPSVFEASEIDVEKMVRQAHDLRVSDIPPRVEISVVEEDRLRPGIDYFGPSARDEVLFDTPSAIARIARSSAYMRRMVVSAERTRDPNGQPLTFTWTVLRGDPGRIVVTPLNEDASRAELRIAWHDRRSVPLRPELSTDRVDIAVFAHNGARYSAPAFVSVTFPPTQARRYDEAGRILEIDHAPAGDRYADPVLFPARDWRDRYVYTEDGELIGWDRTSNGATRRFTRHGARVVETDGAGRAIRAERIGYRIATDDVGRRKIVEVPTGMIMTYRYDTASDQLGRAEF
jgi:hypothetical protein